MANDTRADEQSAMAEQTGNTPPAADSSGAKERKSPIKGAHQRDLDAIAALAAAWEADTKPGQGVTQATHDACRESALHLLASLASTIAAFRDEEREYSATGKWYGFVRRDGVRFAEQCSAVPTAASHPSMARCVGPFSGKIPAEVFAKCGKHAATIGTVFAAK